MKTPLRHWRPAGRIVALALVLAAVPLPGWAGEPGQPPPAPGLKASIAKAATSGSAALEQSKPQAPDRSQLASKSFFKTPAGIVTIIVVGIGTGFAVYSAKHDRIHSVVRQNQ